MITFASLAIEDLVIPQGATVGANWPVSWTYYESGAPKDLTGWSAIADIRADQRRESQRFARFGTVGVAGAVGTITLNQQPGLVVMSAPAAAFASAQWRTGWYDVELRPPAPSLEVVRLVSGRVRLADEVTADV